MTPVCTLEITRGAPSEGSRTARFEVPFQDGMSLLDAIAWVRANLDPSLAVRFSCRSANACKECSALIDGKPGYLCVAKAQPGVTARIAPLPRRPRIRDLVVELEPADRQPGA